MSEQSVYRQRAEVLARLGGGKAARRGRTVRQNYSKTILTNERARPEATSRDSGSRMIDRQQKILQSSTSSKIYCSGYYCDGMPLVRRASTACKRNSLKCTARTLEATPTSGGPIPGPPLLRSVFEKQAII